MPTRSPIEPFVPERYGTFRFLHRSIDERGRVRLGYALDDDLELVEELDVPVGGTAVPDPRAVEGALALLHWTAGVSYYKTAIPPAVAIEGDLRPAPAVAALLDALYSEGLGELAYVNGLDGVPRPRFPSEPGPAVPAVPEASPPRDPRVLVPVGGGKDSAVALEIVRRSGLDLALFSVGDAAPIARTAEVAGLPRLRVTRRLDPRLRDLNAAGALNGHVPVTAIVACVAVLTAVLNGYDAVALANERSASRGNVAWDGLDINHQFSKGHRAELLLSAAVRALVPRVEVFSVLRPASELAIARAFARLPQYHGVFTSCNAIFRLDPALRSASWCTDCPKCRFVFLILAPFLDPDALEAIFGRALLDDESQYEGFARLTATGGHKPFECVGEEDESVAAIRLLAADPRWRDRPVVRRLAAEVLPATPLAGDPAAALALSDEHQVPASILPAARAVLGA